VHHQPDKPVKRDSRQDEHAGVPRFSAGENEGNGQPVQRSRRYFGRPENIISLLTLVAVGVYTSLTYCLLNAERESYTRVQRAFVFPVEFAFRMERAKQRIGIKAVWKNGGDTPTRNLRISITEGRRKAPLPADFDFPSDDQNTYGGHSLPILVLGPHASVSGIRRAELPLSAVSDINSGRDSVYLWGYARYDDVFGAPHLTRYCVQITSIETDLAGGSSDVTVAHDLCDSGNCADEECAAEKIPSPG
jgi:hypothetical protein